MVREEGPLNLTMPMPPSPLGVDIAEIVSFMLIIDDNKCSTGVEG
jgi:hypothetical protein